jgi:fumarate reductase flavoprotein subunit
MTGTVLEEGLRGAGGYLLDGAGERFMFAYDERGERATRDVVSRSIEDRIRKGFATPNGGVWIEMAHLGPDNVRRGFKGMVERCADCGFDLAAGRVEVVPTAHYMMGGVVFGPDCATPMHRLFAAGEDTGGVHGANRLGGNGVANSTVFGALAGDAMAPFARAQGAHADPDPAAVEAGLARVEAPFRRPPGDLNAVRERLYDATWEDVGILRTAAGLRRGLATLGELDAGLDEAGVADGNRAFNLTWHDWLNLKNLVLVSRAIAAAALEREDSRGAHFREDFPAASDLATSRYTVARLEGEGVAIATEPVRFTRVIPGETLLREAAE